MPPSTHDAKADFEIDRATNTIRFSREFEAPAAKVFRAWTEPQHVACWWDAGGERLEVCEIDLRPGGAFTFANRRQPAPFSGVYLEITPPAILVFEAMGATGRVHLADTPGGSKMTVEIRCPSAEGLEEYLQMGVHIGTSQTLDNLVTYMGEAMVPV